MKSTAGNHCPPGVLKLTACLTRTPFPHSTHPAGWGLYVQPPAGRRITETAILPAVLYALGPSGVALHVIEADDHTLRAARRGQGWGLPTLLDEWLAAGHGLHSCCGSGGGGAADTAAAAGQLVVGLMVQPAAWTQPPPQQQEQSEAAQKHAQPQEQ